MTDESGNQTPAGGTPQAPAHYKEPGWFTRNVFNRTVAVLTRSGVSVLGSRVLEVRGRKSGEPRRTPVNLLTLDGVQYLVSPRGETQWVRNVRAADGELYLLLGRRREHSHAEEIVDEKAKMAVIRAYLKRWKAEVGVFFDGVGPDSSDEEMRRVLSRPVFRLSSAS